MKLLKKARDPEFWKEVREAEHFKKYRDELLAAWDKWGEYNCEVMKYSEFKLFWTTGNRDIYQKPYFDRRYVIETAALLALIYPEEEKYILKLMDMIYSVCDEYTWCLPAHQRVLETNNRRRDDLFATETGFMFAEILTLLGDRLDPLIRNRMIAETKYRVVDPFVSVEDYGWWEHGNMNWTAVCMGSIACTVMLMFPELANDAFIDRTVRSMDGFLSGFYDDGVCLEGPGYWGYGFGFFMMYADMLRDFTDGRIDFFKREKVKNVATFKQKTFISENCSISFADSGRKASYSINIMHYLKKEYPSDIVLPDVKYANFGSGKFCTHLRAALFYNNDYVTSPDSLGIDETYYAPDSEWLIKKTPNYGFAAKGGVNNEPHNHNDVGNFIFAKNGRQLICDLGSGVYTRQYFTSEIRYKMLEPSSRGHSLPIIGGNYQKAGGQYKATAVTYENGVFTMDIAAAYGCESIRSVKRSFSFTDDSVRLTDVFDADGETVERFMAVFEPRINDDGYVQIENAVLEYDKNNCTVIIEKEEASRPIDVWSVNFKLKSNASEFSLIIK